MKDARTAPAIQLRLPTELKNWLKHQAIDNHRSLNGEVLARIEQTRALQTQGAAA